MKMDHAGGIGVAEAHGAAKEQPSGWIHGPHAGIDAPAGDPLSRWGRLGFPSRR